MLHATETSAVDPTEMFEVVRVFGRAFVRADDEAVVADALLRWRPCDDRPRFVVTPNVDILVLLARDGSGEVRRLVDGADLVLPDGAPIVAASNLAGNPRLRRLAGSTIFAHLWPQLVASQRPVSVLAASDTVAAGLRADGANADIEVAPMFGDDPDAYTECARALIERAVAHRSELVVIGLSFPKDVRLVEIVQRDWPAGTPAPIVLCFGAGPELYLGLRRRAPAWMQRLGLEWFHRFAQEPRRLFVRYFVRDAAFLPMAARTIARQRLGLAATA